MNLLGLNFLHANAAAAVFVDGRLVAAAEEERFNRVKFSAGLPLRAIAFCLKQAGLEFREIDVITYARTTNTRIVDQDQIHYQDRIYRIDSLYDRYRMNLRLINFKETLADYFDVPVEALVFKLREADHHLSHMKSGFHYCPFDQALLLSCDAFGDFITLRTGVGQGNDIELLDEVRFPHSVGLFYTMVTQFLGFPSYGDESKVMGLSTFGEPRFVDELSRLIDFREGKLSLNLDYFSTTSGIGTSWSQETPDITRLFDENLKHLLGPPREAGTPLEKRHQDLAASLQQLTEEVFFRIIQDLCSRRSVRNLVFTGGMAYNSLLNSRILQQTEIERLYVPPAPGNSGLAIGSALTFLGERAERVTMTHAFWGPEESNSVARSVLRSRRISCREVEDPIQTGVEQLLQGKVLGWFQGRMEFGPRSLGNRSILINPSGPQPHRAKQRDLLKPFGISLLAEKVPDFFPNPHDSPFMSFMERIRDERQSDFEAVLLNHYCRYHSVGPENSTLHLLLQRFYEKTSTPFLINTSLNAEGEPIVATVEDLIDSLSKLLLDVIIVGNLVCEERP